MPEKQLPTIEIKDTQSMENIHWEDCVLLLKIGTGEIQVGIFKRDLKYFIRLLSYVLSPAVEEKDLTEIVKNILAENKIMTGRCKKVQVVIDTPLYTAIPETHYEKDMQKAYFSFLFGEDKDWELKTDHVDSAELHLIYAVNKHFLIYLKDDFRDFSIIHEQALLLKNVKHTDAQQAVMYVSLHAEFTSVIVFSKGIPILIQSYKTKEALDAVYYVLNVKENLKLSDKTLLYLDGLQEDSEIVGKLQNVFGQISHMNRPSEGQFPSSIDQFPSYYFYHLVSLALCESLAENTEAEE